MGLFTKDIKTFEDLFLHGLKDMYYAENKIVRTLPVLIDNASDAELKRGLRQHLEETEHQIGRLEHAFRLFGQKPQGTKCYGIHGLLSESDELMGNVAGKNLLNAAVITSAQAVEHYEITRYGSLIAWANEMGRRDIARILEETLAEEKAADQKLSKIAEGRVNRRAGGKRPLARAKSVAARRTSASRRRSQAGDRRRSSRK